MKTACMIVLISIVSCVSVAFCYPSKPLDERSTELAWEAWLLVDQNNRQSDMGLLRRRITPKSIFIVPTFTPEALPACAEGYTSDSMGRCVKMIKINDSNHLDFLLQNLNHKFSTKGKKRPAETTTKGPLQLNIPLLDNEEEKIFENESDIAVIMTPSNKSHETNSTSVKADGKKYGDKFSVENIAAMLGVNPDDVEVTTIDELTTTAAFTTTMRNDDETTTFQSFTTTGGSETTTDTATTETIEDTTLLEGDAIFFRMRI